MTEKDFSRTSLFVTVTVTIAIWSLLAWDHFHGGVPSIHALHREDMPAISNWWGGLLLPLITWFVMYRIRKRLTRDQSNPTRVLYGFAGALIYGVLLSFFFTFGNPDIPGYMMIGLFLFALFFPVYRAECVLGFVIGMTFTFGPVLPIAAGSIFALIGAVLYLYVRSAVLYLASRFSHNP